MKTLAVLAYFAALVFLVESRAAIEPAATTEEPCESPKEFTTCGSECSCEGPCLSNCEEGCYCPFVGNVRQVYDAENNVCRRCDDKTTTPPPAPITTATEEPCESPKEFTTCGSDCPCEGPCLSNCEEGCYCPFVGNVRQVYDAENNVCRRCDGITTPAPAAIAIVENDSSDSSQSSETSSEEDSDTQERKEKQR